MSSIRRVLDVEDTEGDHLSLSLSRGWDKSHGLLTLSHVWQHVKLSDALSWGQSAI